MQNSSDERGLFSLDFGFSAGWGLSLWATLCGGLASGVRSPSPPEALRFLLALLMVAVGWWPFWQAATATDWAALLRRWRGWTEGDVGPLLPYTRPGSPAYRLARWLGQLTSWGRAIFLPAAGRTLAAGLLGLAVAGVLAAAVGKEAAIWLVGAVALAQMALVRSRGARRVGAGWHALAWVGFPWLAGHLAMAPLSLPSLALAGAFSLAALGRVRTAEAPGRLAWSGGFMAAAFLFLLLGRPLAIPYLILLMLMPFFFAFGDRGDRRPRALWLLGGMLLAAVAL